MGNKNLKCVEHLNKLYNFSQSKIEIFIIKFAIKDFQEKIQTLTNIFLPQVYNEVESINIKWHSNSITNPFFLVLLEKVFTNFQNTTNQVLPNCFRTKECPPYIRLWEYEQEKAENVVFSSEKENKYQLLYVEQNGDESEYDATNLSQFFKDALEGKFFCNHTQGYSVSSADFM